MDRNTPFIQSSYIFETYKVVKMLGLSTEEPFNSGDFDLAQYEENPVSLSINQVNQYLTTHYSVLKMPYLGLAVGHQWRISCHGLAGVSAMAQQTYGECLQAASRLCDKALPALSMEYFDDGEHVGLHIRELISMKPYSHFYLEAITVNFNNILRFLLGNEFHPSYVAFPFEAPGYKHVFKRYLKCDIQFEAEQCTFAVHKSVGERELLLANQDTAAMAEHYYMKSVPDIDLNYLPRKLRLLLIQSMGAFPSIETAARKIGMSGRTLRRKLNSLGTNYQNEIDQLRQEFAILYLTKSDKSITEIALKLGYSDSSSFSNAFKNWLGESPRDFRTRHADEGFNCDDNEHKS